MEQLVEMGFTETRAQKALVKVSNGGVEPAINWLAEHLEVSLATAKPARRTCCSPPIAIPAACPRGGRATR